MYYVLRDRYGIPCGSFFLDTDRAICPENLRGKQDLVVLAESAEHLDVHDVIKEQTYIERLKEKMGIECKPTGQDVFRTFAAMVVQWDDSGVAYRKSSRVVCVTRVAMGYALGEGAVWREVVLR
ncbi:hypothetical protein B0T20DRAFT_390953 [Sordaria brevicollis]|uniref:Uncharacterized protein n=1 Tax=Sordaria brevicollis TaxID=83679 RepID=A0AAE0PJG6_SORBR|nr:hypothetical protein B0T20DRAFT_390953 [Sordaria brevicollis]